MKSAELKFSKTSTHVVLIRVFSTLGALRRYHGGDGKKKPSTCVGFCLQSNQPGVDNVIATIALCQKHLTVEVIAHEVCHAAWHRIRLMGLTYEGSDFQEYLAISTGLLTDTILAWCSKEGIKVGLECVPSHLVVTVRKS